MTRVKLTSKNQITVPSEVRRRLDLRPGDYLTIEVRDSLLILRPEPHNHAEHLRGLFGEIWRDIDPDEYVWIERDAWRS